MGGTHEKAPTEQSKSSCLRLPLICVPTDPHGYSSHIADDGCERLAVIVGNDMARAQEIVHRVNVHDALLAACKAAAGSFDLATEAGLNVNFGAYTLCRDAIARAESGAA